MHQGDDLITRRRLVGSAATAVGAVALGGPAEALAKRRRHRTRFDHVVVVMMENRSFDHLLGWLAGADGRQAGLRLHRSAGGAARDARPRPGLPGLRPSRSRPLRPRAAASSSTAAAATAGCARARTTTTRSATTRRQDLSFLGPAATHWTTFDRYFAAIMAETFPNRIYQHAAQTDRLTQHLHDLDAADDLGPPRGRRAATAATTTATCRSSRCGARGTCRSLGRSTAFFARLRRRARCPQVSFVDPRFVGEDQRHVRATTTRTPTSGTGRRS